MLKWFKSLFSYTPVLNAKPASPRFLTSNPTGRNIAYLFINRVISEAKTESLVMRHDSEYVWMENSAWREFVTLRINTDHPNVFKSFRFIPPDDYDSWVFIGESSLCRPVTELSLDESI